MENFRRFKYRLCAVVITILFCTVLGLPVTDTVLRVML